MQADDNERWKELCELASKEQDSEKLHRLIKEINELLEAKAKAFAGGFAAQGGLKQRPQSTSSTSSLFNPLSRNELPVRVWFRAQAT